MTKSPFVVVFLMVLTLGLSVGFATEDVPETAYDESETPSYDGTPPFSIVVVQVATRAAEDGPACVSPVRFAFLNGRCKRYLPYGPRPVHPHLDFSAIFDCSFRC